MITTIIATVILLGVLIFVHELGHFLVAKLVGVRVERFSLGFPPKAIGKKIGETEYMLSWIPLGGYVKMFGENPDEEESVPPEERHRSFSHKPPWARFLIVLAGPAFNFVFAIAVFWAIFTFNGIEHFSTEVGRIQDNSPAAEAGILPGDHIRAINGEPVRFFEDMTDRIGTSDGRPIELTLERAARTIQVTVTPQESNDTNIFGEEIPGWSIGVEPYLSPMVGGVQLGMPAEAAGIEVGDRIVSIDGQAVKDWYDVLAFIRAAKGREIPVTVQRDGREITVNLVPKMVSQQDVSGEQVQVPMIGIERRDEMVIEKIGPASAFYYGLARTYELSRLTIVSVVKLFERKISVKTLGGPIFIAEMAGRQAKAGLLQFISLAALISLNLGILNLLPIPVLDGGHLFFFLLEMIIRRPVSINIRERAQQAGMVFLLAFMIFVFYNDIARIVTRWNQSRVPVNVEQNENPGSGHVNP